MVIKHREAAHGDREDFRELYKPVFDPDAAVKISLAEQTSTANAAGDAVIPASDRQIDKPSPSDGHARSPGSGKMAIFYTGGHRILTYTFTVKRWAANSLLE